MQGPEPDSATDAALPLAAVASAIASGVAGLRSRFGIRQPRAAPRNSHGPWELGRDRRSDCRNTHHYRACSLWPRAIPRGSLGRGRGKEAARSGRLAGLGDITNSEKGRTMKGCHGPWAMGQMRNGGSPHRSWNCRRGGDSWGTRGSGNQAKPDSSSYRKGLVQQEPHPGSRYQGRGSPPGVNRTGRHPLLGQKQVPPKSALEIRLSSRSDMSLPSVARYSL